MGKVRTELVKRVAVDLVDRYPRSFGASFEQNKQFLREIKLETTKRLRNRIAGYITRIERMEKAPAQEAVAEVEEEPTQPT